MIEEIEWFILNGNIKGDEGGECTYVGARGKTVIDYVITDEGRKKGIERIKVGKRVNSDHFPLIVSIRGKGELESTGKEKEKRGVWIAESVGKFREKIRMMRKKYRGNDETGYRETKKSIRRGGAESW